MFREDGSKGEGLGGVSRWKRGVAAERIKMVGSFIFIRTASPDGEFETSGDQARPDQARGNPVLRDGRRFRVLSCKTVQVKEA